MANWLRIGGPNGITFLAWALLSPISVFFTWAWVPEGYLPGAMPIAGIAVGVIGHLMTGLVLALGRWLLLKNVALKPRPTLTLLIFLAAGAARGLSVSFGLEALGVTAQADYSNRMTSGALLILAWFSVSAILVDRVRSYRAGFEDLSAKIQKLQVLTIQGQSQLAKTQQELMQQVSDTLKQALASGNSPKDIHDALDSMIRPLVRNMTSVPDLETQYQVPKRRLAIGPILKIAIRETAYNPVAVALLAVLGSLYSRIWQGGWMGIFDSIATAVIVIVTFSLARKFKVFGLRVLWVWFAAGFISSTQTVLLSGSVSVADLPTILTLSVNVFIPAVLIAVLRAFSKESENNLGKLSEVAKSLEWQSASLLQRDGVQRRRIARFVHSDLQSRLRVFALRLEISGSSPTDQELEAIKAECEDLLGTDLQHSDFGKFTEDIRELWLGVLEIEFQVTSAVLNQLKPDPFCSAAAIEVVREALSNAVRHGKASNAVVTLGTQARHDASLELQILVRDNGTLDNIQTYGYGLSTIEELSKDHALTNESGATELKATLSLSLN
jgi:signal transduction histidine kinase